MGSLVDRHITIGPTHRGISRQGKTWSVPGREEGDVSLSSSPLECRHVRPLLPRLQHYLSSINKSILSVHTYLVNITYFYYFTDFFCIQCSIVSTVVIFRQISHKFRSRSGVLSDLACTIAVCLHVQK